jgi:hypothetical protein
LPWALLLVSAVAIAFGVYAIVSMLTLPPGGHFEGYLVLMGLLLGGHGVSALVYALLTMRGGPARGISGDAGSDGLNPFSRAPAGTLRRSRSSGRPPSGAAAGG